ncbi:MAG: carbonic anhydrase [Bdellovibrionales bacterium]|nr:carbonic anhydrase [Bdellovibrionales bacterium]
MKKLVKGIVDFRQRLLPEYREKFAQLALGQSPDTLFIACSDSRVVPNLFASTNPGDLFVVRNVGNLIPCCADNGHSSADESEAAAIEFSVLNLRVSDIVVCGHSECGAMHALMEGRERIPSPNLRAWLRHGEPSLAGINQGSSQLSPINRLSQENVLQQIRHLYSYPSVSERLAQGNLKLHGWWFELSTANVYAYKESLGRFALIEKEEDVASIGFEGGLSVDLIKGRVTPK